MKRLHVLTAVAAASLLVACGGGGGDENTRGGIKETPQTVATLTTAQLDAATAASGLQALAANASGALLVPTGAACLGPFPLV
eukprot:gene21245-27262_t